ncbi:MAG: TrpR-like protein [Oscillospiraceae bacterium]|nr:TrpR-like protein [Oscillospiraceae bacterium]
MNTRAKREHNPALYEAILSLQTTEECLKFFEDLCTMSELSAMEQRYQVARALHDGKIYNEILAETGASSATISRVNRSIQYGAGGYDLVFARLEDGEK